MINAKAPEPEHLPEESKDAGDQSSDDSDIDLLEAFSNSIELQNCVR